MTNKKVNILVVDDDEMARKMMEAMLAPQGYGVILARDGKEGVSAALSKKPDFILMDMMMPGMDGLTACHEIKTNPATKGIPVFMLTAVSGDGNRQMAQQVWGADGYLTKPVDLHELLNTITRNLKAG
ncbi:MAG TPA: response regulator [Dehalococcoidales bacterium]